MANVMDALGDYSSQYWEVFVEYFCVVFEKMNQIVSHVSLFCLPYRHHDLSIVPSVAEVHDHPLVNLLSLKLS